MFPLGSECSVQEGTWAQNSRPQKGSHCSFAIYYLCELQWVAQLKGVLTYCLSIDLTPLPRAAVGIKHNNTGTYCSALYSCLRAFVFFLQDALYFREHELGDCRGASVGSRIPLNCMWELVGLYICYKKLMSFIKQLPKGSVEWPVLYRETSQNSSKLEKAQCL